MNLTKNKIRLSFWGIVFLIGITSVFDFPSYYNALMDSAQKTLKVSLPKIDGKPFLLGLDLQGGTHLVYEADVREVPPSERSSAIEGVKDVLDRRVNAFGVSEPVIQSGKSGDNWNVIVELAGVRDVKQAIQMIGETPQLDFRLQATTTEPTLNTEEKKELEKYNTDAKKRAEGILKTVLKKPEDFEKTLLEKTEQAEISETKGMLGLLTREELKNSVLSGLEAVCFDELKTGKISKNISETSFGFHIVKKIDEQTGLEDTKANCQQIFIKKKTPQDIHPVQEWIVTPLSGEHLKRTQVVFDPNSGFPQVSLEFNAEGQELFKNITTENVGRIVGIFLDGSLISAPRVNEPIIGGNAVISGNFGIQEAKLLSQRLNAGALRVPIRLVSQQTVGPTLGKISIQKSINATIIGLIAVLIFMIVFYRLPGFLADIALLAYGFITLAIFKLMPVTLTLAGIAGFILSVGMAVDANILVFERMKEELKRGKSLGSAIDEGFKRAWPSIRDGNYSTLLTSFILMWFSTSIVKGFAITLSIGIFISIFTSMFITRIFLKIVVNKNTEKWMWIFLGARGKKT